MVVKLDLYLTLREANILRVNEDKILRKTFDGEA
jgi:hypothetical protein